MHIVNIEPKYIDEDTVKFIGNNAGEYGDKFSSEAHRLVYIP